MEAELLSPRERSFKKLWKNFCFKHATAALLCSAALCCLLRKLQFNPICNLSVSLHMYNLRHFKILLFGASKKNSAAHN